MTENILICKNENGIKDVYSLKNQNKLQKSLIDSINSQHSQNILNKHILSDFVNDEDKKIYQNNFKINQRLN